MTNVKQAGGDICQHSGGTELLTWRPAEVAPG